MTEIKNNEDRRILVAVDIAKAKHVILMQWPDGRRQKMAIQNRRQDLDEWIKFLKEQSHPCLVGFEPTADYHRPIAYWLQQAGIGVTSISSVAVARTREALHNSWDKNDPKDAQVILHLMATSITQHFHDPLIAGNHDLQELSKTHFMTSLRRKRLYHSLVNHYLAIYFPEAEKFLHSTRAHWFSKLLIKFPTPGSILKCSEEEFIKQSFPLLGPKQSKTQILSQFYQIAQQSIGLPVAEDSIAIETFRSLLVDFLRLTEERQKLERQADALLKEDRHYRLLRSVPGIGPIIGLTILAEAGDLNRFHHERAFLKYCGMDLSTEQSGYSRGQPRLSKRGNPRLRTAFWQAATVAIRQRENSFRSKYERYVKSNPLNSDLKRKAYSAVAAKIARVVYHMIRSNKVYRPLYEQLVPRGRTHSDRAVEAAC